MQWFHIIAWPLMILFAIGVIGCAITIPLAAIKFFAVLFEKDEPEETRLSEPEALPPSSMRPAS